MADRTLIFAAVLVVAAASLNPRDAGAAGAAYQVDTAEVSEAGACKVESWMSSASNHDFFGAVSPACVFDFGKPTELSTQFNRARSDGDWATAATPKVKMNLLPGAIGRFSVAVSAQATVDLITQQNTAIAATVPATLRLSEVVRINLNAGWLWDRTADRHYATYGAGLDLRTPDNVWILTAELFGQLGAADADTPSVVRPRAQIGLRWRPVDRFNIDLIYGRNLNGENANWITAATVIRFPPPEKQ